ncbi:unnamed protein product [Lasius platythorax]|uniref:Uncharacterized protein n=1 Tax=Lasius platythorax TaxID=488582 RepID=A0AAV2NB86_9HYME
MFKKENAQFYVGAAVGVTVGLCVGKLLSPNTSIVIQNKIYPNTSDIKNTPVHQSIGKTLKLEDASINKHKYHSNKSAPRCSDNNFKDSTLLMTPLVKPESLNDSNINIDTKTPVKEVKLYKKIPTYESYQILGEEKNVSQNTEAYFVNKSYNVEEKIHNSTVYAHENTIPSANSTLKSDLFNVKKTENIPGITFIELSSDSSNESISLPNDSNIATCNTIINVEQASLTSTLNDYESSDIKQCDEFNEYNLISSTKYDISIPF